MLLVSRIDGKLGSVYRARLSIDMKETVKRAGFLWDSIDKAWQTHSPKTAYRLIDYCDPQTKESLLYELDLNVSDKRSIIVHPSNKTPFKHQIEGARWVLSRRASFLAFEAGTGKTAIAALCMNARQGKTLIICPAFLKYNWEAELNSWLTYKPKIQIIHQMKEKVDLSADVFIMPDSLLHVDPIREDLLAAGPFEFIFIDEVHRFKNPDAKRTMSLLGAPKVKVANALKTWKGFHKNAKHVVSLSGTPIQNRPIEIYPVVKAHAPHAVEYYDKHHFALKYCGAFEGEWGWDYSGNSNEEELRKNLTRDYMLIKKLEDCVDLPEKLPYEFIHLGNIRTETQKESEMKFLKQMRLDELIEHEAEINEEFASKLMATAQTSMIGFVSELRKNLGLRKIKPAVKIIEEILEDADKLVVFCWHQEVAESLTNQLEEYGALKITGATPQKTRHEYVQRFQNDKSVRVLVANIQSAGVGITLTKSSRVLFVEASWVPSDNEQAVSRCHRIGQTKPVLAQFLVIDNSIDHMILNAHQYKSKVIDKIIQPNKQGEKIKCQS